MPNTDAYYRILGLPPGATPEEVKHAYRDLAQVWHPDRFAHDARLREKADANLRRINEAYEKLRQVQAAQSPPRRASRLSETYQAIIEMGDMVRTSLIGVSSPKKERKILGLNQEPRRRKKRSMGQVVLYVVGIVGALLFVAGVLYIVGT